jgi:proline iminopeptidase
MTELYVTRHGRGRPLVVLHGGLGLDHSSMRSLDPLGDIAELIYIDHRGNGRSPPHDGMTLESMADELDALRAELGHDRWTVLGHSYGALIALVYASRHPERIAALIPIGAATSFAHAPGVLASLGRRGHPEAVAALLEALPEPTRDDAHFAEVWWQILPLYFHAWDAKYRAAFEQTKWSAAGYNRGNELLQTYDVADRLDRITAPTLVVSGDDDFIMPAEIGGAAVARGIANARHVVIPNTGHFPFLENPAVFHAEVRAFLTA